MGVDLLFGKRFFSASACLLPGVKSRNRSRHDPQVA